MAPVLCPTDISGPSGCHLETHICPPLDLGSCSGSARRRCPVCSGLGIGTEGQTVRQWGVTRNWPLLARGVGPRLAVALLHLEVDPQSLEQLEKVGDRVSDQLQRAMNRFHVYCETFAIITNNKNNPRFRQNPKHWGFVRLRRLCWPHWPPLPSSPLLYSHSKSKLITHFAPYWLKCAWWNFYNCNHTGFSPNAESAVYF